MTSFEKLMIAVGIVFFFVTGTFASFLLWSLTRYPEAIEMTPSSVWVGMTVFGLVFCVVNILEDRDEKMLRKNKNSDVLRH